MLDIYRPYADPIRTSQCLWESDLSLMKHNSHILITVICEILGWSRNTGVSEFHVDDPFVEFYMNDGNPDLNFLIDYHFAMHVALKKSCGEKVNMLVRDINFMNVYDNHKAECAEVSWPRQATMLHRMYLLKSNHQWYKRHFKKYDVGLYFSGKKVELHRNGKLLEIG